ncbi:hypothetical protein NIES4102_43510 (plasmid) [Chondrocystis sp. NIES-4102]|nr:hypothetical protein NIES4102_43510 [Chondrocystis sp. NIES-4102]
MSILNTSPVNTRHFDMEIAAALGSFEAAVILQQLHYWTQKEGIGVIIDQAKYIYNTFEQWVKNQFTFLSVWKFRKAMSLLRSLEIVKVVRYRSKEWNQTNYYNLNYDKLREWAESVGFSVGIFSPKTRRAQSIEISEMCNSTAQDVKSQTLEMKDSKVSLYRDKEYTKKETTKQNSDRLSKEINSIAAASPKQALQKEINSRQKLDSSAQLNALNSQYKQESEQNKQNIGEGINVLQVDCIVNKKWQELVPLLDGAGIPINRTVSDLLKLYPSAKVESAIALLKARKREKHIPNLSGYFVAALKGDWGSKTLIGSESKGDRQ